MVMDDYIKKNWRFNLWDLYAHTTRYTKQGKNIMNLFPIPIPFLDSVLVDLSLYKDLIPPFPTSL
jgi:hypothetical protein